MNQPTPLPPFDDTGRLAALRRYRILDTLPERAYDDIVALARAVCGTPQAVMTFVDESRQWFKSASGMGPEEETPRDIAFCDVAIRRPDEVTVVPDASLHPLFRHYPQVTGPDHLRFYAGAPMVTPDGHALGTVCVVDQVPRELAPAQREALKALARLAVQLLELRHSQLDGQRLLAERELASRRMADYQQQLEARNAELTADAGRDPLTGLLNRAGLEKNREGTLSAGDGGGFSVAVMDIDHFKRINDRHGHDAGDEVIRVVAEEIRLGVRSSDIAVRYGGEEFLVLMPGTPLAAAAGVIERIRERVSTSQGLPEPVTLSGGLAAGLVGRDDLDAVFRAADQALYRAKRGGRNRIEVAED